MDAAAAKKKKKQQHTRASGVELSSPEVKIVSAHTDKSKTQKGGRLVEMEIEERRAAEGGRE